VREVFAQWDLEAAVIGASPTTASSAPLAGRGGLRAAGRRRSRTRARLPPPGRGAGAARGVAALDLREIAEPAPTTQRCSALLESPNLCAREWIIRQYDQLVGGNTVVRPAATPPWCAIEGRAGARAHGRLQQPLLPARSLPRAPCSRSSRRRGTWSPRARGRSPSATASTTGTRAARTSCGSSSRASTASATPASPSARRSSAATLASTTRPRATASPPTPTIRHGWSARRRRCPPHAVVEGPRAT
jgi:hypothetical protein